MYNEVTFKEIKIEELYGDMLTDFNRYQYVNNDWYPNKDGGYYLVYQPHAENWDDARKREIIKNCVLHWRTAVNYSAHMIQKSLSVFLV